MAWPDEVLAYWFGLTPEQWFRDDSLDGDIADRFAGLWEEQRHKPADAFLGSSREALAAVILFDQFPRNMFRDQPQGFATDWLALAIAKAAIDRGNDSELKHAERSFLYMPFQHSESLEDQERGVALFEDLGIAEQARFARLHRDVIERFGRFPHRNAILGREPSEAELEAGNVEPW